MTMLDLAFAFLAQTDPAAPTDAPRQTMLTYIQSGGLISYILILLSFVGLGLMIRNVIVLRMSRLAPPEVVHRLDRLLRDNDTPGAAALCADPAHRGFITGVLGSALARCAKSPFGFLEFRSAIEESGQAEVDRLHRLTDGLGILAAVGPMLGLLGTVIGMIGAFDSIAQIEGAARSQALARFMAMALVNTAEGLVVAIPCTVAFALFRRRIDGLTAEASIIIEELAGHIEQASGGERPAGARAARPAGGAVLPRAVAEGARGVQVS
ncbi:MAG: MotA/TolQ/ExbB proton channel family protein [Phycisphaerales bacterium]